MKENTNIKKLSERLEKEVISHSYDFDPWANAFLSVLNLEDYYREYRKYCKDSFTDFIRDVLKNISDKSEDFVYSISHQSDKWSINALKNVIIRATYRKRKISW